MDGSGVFLAIASIFISNLNGVPVKFSTLVIILITSTALTMATPSVPSSSLFSLIIILTAIDVDTRDVSLLFAVDWILDRLRCTTNVLGDCFAAAVIEKLSHEELKKLNYIKIEQ